MEQITENPYLKYFIGLPGYQETPPFDASTLVLFRKRITAEMLNEANEYLPAHKDDDLKSIPTAFINLSLLKIIAMDKYQFYSLPIQSTVV